MIKIKNKRAMSILEYSALISAIVIALLTMQIFLKSAVQGKWKEAADTFGHGRQYEWGWDPKDLDD